MATIKVIGNAVVIESAIKFADIEQVKKYRPDALTLTDEEKNPLFRIDVGSKPQANEFGIVFDGKTHDENGYATYTQLIPATGGNVKDAIADIYGKTVLLLTKYEEAFPAVLADIKAEREAVLDSIKLQ